MRTDHRHAGAFVGARTHTHAVFVATGSAIILLLGTMMYLCTNPPDGLRTPAASQEKERGASSKPTTARQGHTKTAAPRSGSECTRKKTPNASSESILRSTEAASSPPDPHEHALWRTAWHSIYHLSLRSLLLSRAANTEDVVQQQHTLDEMHSLHASSSSTSSRVIIRGGRGGGGRRVGEARHHRSGGDGRSSFQRNHNQNWLASTGEVAVPASGEEVESFENMEEVTAVDGDAQKPGNRKKEPKIDRLHFPLAPQALFQRVTDHRYQQETLIWRKIRHYFGDENYEGEYGLGQTESQLLDQYTPAEKSIVRQPTPVASLEGRCVLWQEHDGNPGPVFESHDSPKAAANVAEHAANVAGGVAGGARSPHKERLVQAPVLRHEFNRDESERIDHGPQYEKTTCSVRKLVQCFDDDPAEVDPLYKEGLLGGGGEQGQHYQHEQTQNLNGNSKTHTGTKQNHGSEYSSSVLLQEFHDDVKRQRDTLPRWKKSQLRAQWSKPKKKKGKVLISYMVHSWDAETRPGEWSNLAHFWQFGVLDATESTQLYDGADYIFMRARSDVNNVQLCLEHGNVRFYWIPVVPCDLCAHSLILRAIGWDNAYSRGVIPTTRTGTGGGTHPTWSSAKSAPGRPPSAGPSGVSEWTTSASAEERANQDPEWWDTTFYQAWPYKSLIMMNSGTRGPIFAPHSSHWLDVLSMGGNPERPLYYRDELDSKLGFRTVVAATVSWTHVIHVQGFFLLAPLAGIDYYVETFKTACGANKLDCIDKGELNTLYPLLTMRKTFSVYSMGQNFHHYYWHPVDMGLLASQYGHGGVNPTTFYTDPCRTMFFKFGGLYWTNIPLVQARATHLVTLQMRALQGKQTVVALWDRRKVQMMHSQGRRSSRVVLHEGEHSGVVNLASTVSGQTQVDKQSLRLAAKRYGTLRGRKASAGTRPNFFEQWVQSGKTGGDNVAGRDEYGRCYFFKFDKAAAQMATDNIAVDTENAGRPLVLRRGGMPVGAGATVTGKKEGEDGTAADPQQENGPNPATATAAAVTRGRAP